jgi:hypothetical protein
MELLERYLQAVKFWLPKEQKQDIIAELSEDLHSQIEEKETELGRPLNDSEVEAILKQRGRPVLVANRFLPQQYLIGPVLFPIYVFVLKIVALCYLLPWLLVWIGIMTYSPNYRLEHGGWFQAVGSAWASLWSVAFIVLGCVTVVFAVLEQVQGKSHFLENWNPRKLPPVRNSGEIKRSSSITEIVASSVFGVWWWVTYLSSPVIVDRPELRVQLSPAWAHFFWGFLFVTLANIALSATNLARPYWTVRRATFRLASDMVGSSLFCWLMKSNIVAAIAVHGVPTEKTEAMTSTINLWMDRAFPIAIAIGIVVLVGDVYRIINANGRRTPAVQGAAAALV